MNDDGLQTGPTASVAFGMRCAFPSETHLYRTHISEQNEQEVELFENHKISHPESGWSLTVLFFPIWTMKLEIEFCGNGPSGGVDNGLAAVMRP